jgi:hypothetical protein
VTIQTLPVSVALDSVSNTATSGEVYSSLAAFGEGFLIAAEREL